MEERQVPGWVKEHIGRYLDSNGEDGHIWNGVPTLLLTTTGRRSGEARTTRSSMARLKAPTSM